MTRLTNAQLRERILTTASADNNFLMNDLNGTDLLMDAVSTSVKRMKRQQLLQLGEEAKHATYYDKNDPDNHDDEATP